MARPSSSARMKSSPRSACCQFCTTTYSSSSCRNSSAGFSNCAIHFHVIGQHAQRLEVGGLALFQRGEQPLHRFRGVGAMRQHLLQRFLARANLARLRSSAPSISRRSSAAACAASARSSSVRRRSPVTVSSSSLPLRHGLGELLARRFQPLDFGRRHLLFARRPRRFALDARQVFVDLRELVLQRGSLAQQPQDHLPPGSRWLFSRSRTLACNRLALLVDLQHALARLRDLRFQRVHVLLVARRSPRPARPAARPVPAIPSRPARCAARWRRSPSPAIPAVRACARLPRSAPTVAGALR